MGIMAAVEQIVTLVMGGSGRQAQNFIRTRGLNRSRTRIVFDPDDLRGYQHGEAELLLIGDYWNSPAYDAMTELVDAGRLTCRLAE
jgi:hypothetical protein